MNEYSFPFALTSKYSSGIPSFGVGTIAVIFSFKNPTLTVEPIDQSCFERLALIMFICFDGLFVRQNLAMG